MVLLLPLCGFSQVAAYFFGKTKKEIKEHMVNSTAKLVLLYDSNPESDTEYISYESKERVIFYAFYFNKETKVCDKVMVSAEVKELTSTISGFNKESIKIGDNKWISKNNEVETTLYFTPNDKIFSIVYAKL